MWKKMIGIIGILLLGSVLHVGCEQDPGEEMQDNVEDAAEELS